MDRTLGKPTATKKTSKHNLLLIHQSCKFDARDIGQLCEVHENMFKEMKKNIKN